MLTDSFIRKVKPLMDPGLGAEHTAWLLYSLVRMTRPRSVLEIGSGYTTPFLLKGLADNVVEFEDDQARLRAQAADDARLEVLLSEYGRTPYRPRLTAVDDYSDEDSTAHAVQAVIGELGLAPYFELVNANFRGLSGRLEPARLPFDLVWFDCGLPAEYVDFLAEYWPLINPDGGLLAMHYTYWHMPTVRRRWQGRESGPEPLKPNAVLNEIKRQQAAQGLQTGFEALSLVEPHKSRQGSVTLIRRLPETSRPRNADMGRELAALGFPVDSAGFSLDA